MKRILFFIVWFISFSAKADVNLLCERESIIFHPENKLLVAEGRHSITVDTVVNKVSFDDVDPMGYETKGNEITFRYAKDFADYNMLSILTLNKVSGTLSIIEWLSPTKSEDLNIAQKLDENYHIKAHSIGAVCSNVKPLF
jgi:hypothetical protein